MTHGSLSSGIGGFDIGASENGITTLWTCEIDLLRRDILKWQLPNAIHYEDLRKVKKPKYVDIISFGFPCQDISQAKHSGKGLEGEKSGLWYEGWRIIRAVRPRYIIIENTPMLIHKGLRTILGQLAKEGYDAEWNIISCKRFGLPHLRERIFIVAYTDKVGLKKSSGIFDKKHFKDLDPEEREQPGTIRI
jgi:DNA (cytosine-5)-methyltransferase 1